MNKLIKQCAIEAGLYVDVNGKPWPRNMNGEDIEGAYQKFAELIVQDCANFVREEYDHVDAEGIAWYMEIKYGLHGDYA